MKKLLLLIPFVAVGAGLPLQWIASVPLRPGTPAPAYDTNVLTYHTNIVARGGTISSNDLWVVARYVTNEYIIGSWSYSLDESPLAGADTNAALVKLKTGRNSTSNVFLIGSFSSAAVYNPTNGWFGQANFHLDTHFAPSNLVFGVAGVEIFNTSYYSNSVIGGAPVGIFGYDYLDGDPKNLAFASASAGGTEDVTHYVGSVGLSQTAAARNKLGMGLTATVYPNTNAVFGTINGRIESTGGASGAATNTTTACFKIGNHGWFGGGAYCPGVVFGHYRIDSGMPTNLAVFHSTNVAFMMRGLGRIPDPGYPRKMFVISGQSLANGTSSTTSTAAQEAGSVFDNVQLGESTFTGLQHAYNFHQFIRTKTHEAYSQSAAGGETGWKAFQDQLSANSRTNGLGATNDSLAINYCSGGAGPDFFATNYATPTAYTPAGDTAFTTNRFWATVIGIQRQVAFELELTGRGITVPLFPIVNGETLCEDSANFITNMISWQLNQEAQTKALTGQSGDIPFLITQQIACTNEASNSNMLWLHTNQRADFTLAGPKYQFQKYSDDGTHFTNYTQQGELYGKAAEYLMRSNWFEPLRPISASRSTATLTVTFTNTGNFGMTLDTNGLPYVANYGVEYLDDSGSTPTITSVAVAGASSNQLTVVLSGTPTGNKKIRFAYALAGMLNGATGGNSWTNRPRTNIRTHGNPNGISSGLPIYDWAVQCEIPVN